MPGRRNQRIYSHAHGSLDWFNAHTNTAEHFFLTIEKALDFFGFKEGLALLACLIREI